MRHFIQLFTLLSLIFGGCVSTTMVPAGYLRVDPSEDIYVTTYDGRTILFLHGDYEIRNYDQGSGILQGKGKLFLNKERTESKRFKGNISLGEIYSIEARHYSAWHYASVLIFILPLVYAVLIYLWAHSGFRLS